MDFGAKRDPPDAQSSVVVGTAEIVAAVRADKLAMMPGQAM